MSIQSVKAGLLATFFAVMLGACSSTDTPESTGGAVGTATDDGVATGEVSGDSVGGYDAGGIDSVFYFEFDSASLKPEAIAALQLHAQRITARPVHVRLEGHGDERGTREYNIALGERRGNAVKEFLMSQGVDGSLLEVVSYGEESPAVAESNEGAWALNRRVEMK